MSAYVKFVCDFCGKTQIEFETEFDEVDSIEAARSLLEEYGWNTFGGDMCRSCNV